MDAGNWIELAGVAVLVGGAIIGALARDRRMFLSRIEEMRTLTDQQDKKMLEIENNYLSRFKEVNFNIERLGDRFSGEMREHMEQLRTDLSDRFVTKGECALITRIEPH
jgi:hypothetical protein